jgi:hypothetical protein
MDRQQFEAIYKEFEGMERSLLLSKREEYAIDDDCLSNFKVTAAQLGVPPEEVCLVFLMKHTQAVAKAAMDPSTRLDWGGTGAKEGFNQRISDARNYLILLAALIKEREPCSGASVFRI